MSASLLLDCDQSLRIDHEVAYTSPSPTLEFTYILTCDPSFSTYKLDGCLQTSINLPPMHAFVRLDERQLLSLDDCREAIQDALEAWPASDVLLNDFIGTAMRRARDTFESMRDDHNSVHVYYRVRVEHVRVVYDDAEDDSTIEELMEEYDDQNDNYMIPAADSSVEGLETKTITDVDARCSICLEEFDSVGMCMPCSHVFHGDCIKEWLRTSHYCPMCRFEMPMS